MLQIDKSGSVINDLVKSLQWLVAELEMTLGIATTEVFRHPTVSRKNASEASTAKW